MVRFDKSVDGNWAQLVDKAHWPFADKLKISSADSHSWFSLADAFRRAGNLVGQNEASYHGKLAARTDDKNEGKWLNRSDYALWGYGYRPLRPLLWFLLSVALFAIPY